MTRGAGDEDARLSPAAISAAADEANPFAVRLRLAMQNSQLTLEQLSARLGELGTPVTMASLSYWSSGRSVPTRRLSLRAVEHLESLLALQQGWLVGALPTTGAGWDPMAMVPHNARLLAALDELGLDMRLRASTQLARDRLQITPGARTHDLNQLVRVEADSLSRVPLLVAMEEGQHLVELTGLAGTRVERMVELAPESADEVTIMIARLVLSKELVRGDWFDYGYRYRIESAQDFPAEASLARPARTPLLVQEVVFGDELPSRVEYVWRPFQSATDADSVVTQLATGRSVQFAQRDAPAGVHALRWY